MHRHVALLWTLSGLFLGSAGDGRTEDGPKAAHAMVKKVAVGDDAPKLTVKEFVKGEAVARFEKGKIYVVEFWATWCFPCRLTIPHLTELQKEYEDVVFIGVSVCEQDPKQVKPFVKEMGEKMGYRVAVDQADAMAEGWLKAADRDGIPTVFIVDGDGKIAWIGGPGNMEEPLDKIYWGKWDLKAAAAKKKEKAKAITP